MPRVHLYEQTQDTGEFVAFERFSQLRRQPKPQESGELFALPRTLHGARREVAEHDMMRISPLIDSALEQLGSAAACITVIEKPAASVATNSELNLISCALAGSKKGLPSSSLSKLSRTAMRRMKTLNESTPLHFVKVGSSTIDVFGAAQGAEGKRFVSLVIEDGAQELLEERDSFLQSVIPHPPFTLRKKLGKHVPHISVAKTESEGDARNMAEALQAVFPSEMWITLTRIVRNGLDYE